LEARAVLWDERLVAQKKAMKAKLRQERAERARVAAEEAERERAAAAALKAAEEEAEREKEAARERAAAAARKAAEEEAAREAEHAVRRARLQGLQQLLAPASLDTDSEDEVEEAQRAILASGGPGASGGDAMEVDEVEEEAGEGEAAESSARPPTTTGTDRGSEPEDGTQAGVSSGSPKKAIKRGREEVTEGQAKKRSRGGTGAGSASAKTRKSKVEELRLEPGDVVSRFLVRLFPVIELCRCARRNVGLARAGELGVGTGWIGAGT